MDIIVEIGTNEQNQLIRKELEIIQNVYSSFKLPNPLKQIVVPDNFDTKVNEIQGTSDYSSKREATIAVAKNIVKDEGIFLIFSKDLFTIFHDNFTRLHMYLHELLHAYNTIRLPKFNSEPPSERQYLSNLCTLFDEYYANRMAFEIIHKLYPKTSFRYKRNNYHHLKGFIESIKELNYYTKIRSEIFSFRKHGNVEVFLQNIHPYFDGVSKSIIYVYSYIDCSQKLKKFEKSILESKFVNERTASLMDFFRLKYDNNDFDLLDGKNLIVAFMENFGMKFEDTPDGLYCRVVDI